MTTTALVQQIRKKNSFLCVGLDTDPDKIPSHLLEEEDPIFSFNREIIDATQRLAVAYKPNLAFYEAQGISGMISLKKTMEYLKETYPEQFLIADAKRGDIGNTSGMYAKALFEDLQADAVTVAPYMGKDSVEPFLEYQDKHTILLALTSNPGSKDFQTLEMEDEPLFQKVISISKSWKNGQNLMYVVGATQTKYLDIIRRMIPENFLLVPGVGAQGGSLREVCERAMTRNVGLLVNASRSIIYASDQKDFAEAAKAKAQELQAEMAQLLKK